MIINLATEATMISDTEYPDVQEQPVIVENHSNGEGISIVGHDGDNVFIPYRMVKEVTKVMNAFATTKKKSK